MTPASYFDVLAITSKLKTTFDDLAPSEIHLFAYLACLLSLYNGKAVSDWGYEFVATQEGSPYSRSLDSAIEILTNKGHLCKRLSFVSVADAATADYEELQQLIQYKAREPYLNGACQSLFAKPISVIKEAVTSDHDMRASMLLGDARQLLTDSAVDDLHDAFSLLSSYIDESVSDLMVPAVVWLSFLQSQIAEG